MANVTALTKVRMDLSDAEIVERLGGTAALAAQISQRLAKAYSPQAVSHWKVRGIPYRLRPHVAEIAQERDLAEIIPDNFLTR